MSILRLGSSGLIPMLIGSERDGSAPTLAQREPDLPFRYPAGDQR